MKILSHLIVFLTFFALPMTAGAADGVLTLVSEHVAEGEPAYWWATSTPQWTATDVALRKALVQEGVGFSEPAGQVNLSRIYRKATPTDANALAMASVFGHDRALVGTVTLSPTAVRPAGIAGWRAKVELRLIEAKQGTPRVVSRIALARASWGGTDEEALAELRRTVAADVARSLTGATVTRNGPVGFASGEVVLGFRGVATTARLDAIRRALRGLAGVEEVTIVWAAQGFIALEVNPGTPDSAENVNRYASLLAQQTFEGFSLRAVDASFPDVVEFNVEGSR